MAGIVRVLTFFALVTMMTFAAPVEQGANADKTSVKSREKRDDDANPLAVTVAHLAQKVTEMEAKLQTALKFTSEPAVAFTVRIKAFDQTGYGDRQVVHFDNVIFNAGSAYNTANGVFTAPRPGTYDFFLQTMRHGTDANPPVIQLDVMKNDVFLSRVHAGYSQYENGSNLVVTHLNEGDRIKVEVAGGKSFTGDLYTTFTGFRVSPY